MKKNEYLVSVSTKILFVLLTFINSVIINRYLGPALKGEYAYILNISNIITMIIGLNISSSFPYFQKKYGEGTKNTIINIIYKQLSIYVICVLLILPLVKNVLWVYVIVLSIVVQFSNQIDFMAIISNINLRNKTLLKTSVIYSLVLILIFIYTKTNVLFIIAALLFYNLLRTILLISHNYLTPKLHNKKTISTKEILIFSIVPMLTTLLTTFNYNIDIIILKSFVSNSEIGLYSLGVTLAAMLWVIPDAFKEVLFNRTAKNDSISQIVLSIKVNVYISVLIIVGFIFLGEKFIALFYGIEYLGAYGVSLILFIGTIPMIFFKIINTLYLAIGKQKYSFYVLLISVIMNVIMNYVTIPVLGLVGAAASSVLCYLFCGIVMLLSFKNKYKISIKSFFILSNNDVQIIRNIIKRQ